MPTHMHLRNIHIHTHTHTTSHTPPGIPHLACTRKRQLHIGVNEQVRSPLVACKSGKRQVVHTCTRQDEDAGVRLLLDISANT